MYCAYVGLDKLISFYCESTENTNGCASSPTKLPTNTPSFSPSFPPTDYPSNMPSLAPTRFQHQKKNTNAILKSKHNSIRNY